MSKVRIITYYFLFKIIIFIFYQKIIYSLLLYLLHYMEIIMGITSDLLLGFVHSYFPSYYLHGEQRTKHYLVLLEIFLK